MSLSAPPACPRTSASVDRLGSFANLPIEVVIAILCSAARSCKSTSSNLCLVSSWARRVAIPKLYRKVELKNEEMLLRFVDSSCDVFPLIETLVLGPGINNLSNPCSLKCIRSTLDKAVNLDHLAIESNPLAYLDTCTHAGDGKVRLPRSVAIIRQSGGGLENNEIRIIIRYLNPCTALNVTHLEMHGVLYDDGSYSFEEVFQAFPSLTHFAFTKPFCTLAFNPLSRTLVKLLSDNIPDSIKLIVYRIVFQEGTRLDKLTVPWILDKFKAGLSNLGHASLLESGRLAYLVDESDALVDTSFDGKDLWLRAARERERQVLR